MLARCCNALLRRYSSFLYNYPYVFLILTPICLVFCVVFSFIPPVGPDFPDFSEPTLGFEPRGTEIMKRVVTRENTLNAAIQAEELTCTPPNQTKRKKRSNPQTLPLCHTFYYRYDSVVTIYESGGDLFNVDDLKTICSMEESIVRSTPGFDVFCSCRVRNGFECGPSLSLGSYIASIRNRSSCQAITTLDVSYTRNLLETCSDAFFFGELENNNGPAECIQNRVKDVFDLMVDIDYLRNDSKTLRNDSKTLKSTMVLSPRLYDTDFARDIYDQHLSGSRPERDGVELVAFKFGEFKFDQFNLQLLKDAFLPAIGFVMVAVIILIYTNSLLVMSLTIFSIITSIIVAYFIYHQVFRLTFFPFLNILTFVFLIGISADDAFVFSDVWAQAKLAIPNGSITDWIEYTLSHAALSMFVTSFTTAAAFYSNIVSDITAIRLFGIFAGTSILIKYSLMITWFPAGVVFMEKRRHSRNINIGSMELQENPAIAQISKHPSGDDHIDSEERELQENPAVAKTSQPPDGEVSPTHSHHGSSTNVIGHSSQTDDIEYSSRQVTQNSTPVCCVCCVCCIPLCSVICPWFDAVRSKCGKIMRDLFEKWIPSALRGYPIWLIALLALGIGMACAVTVSPGLQRPKSSEFQVFASSHILEQYDLKYKNKFRLESSSEFNDFWVYIYFGFKAEDNGNYLEPKNFGELKYDDDFNVVLSDVQEWLMGLCSDIRKLKFFGNVPWTCFPEKLKEVCSNDSFPFNKSGLEYCITEKYYPSHTTCGPHSSGLFFRGSEVVGISLPFPTNIPYTNEYSKVDELWQDIKDFSSVLDGAPKGIKNGWAISWLRFYALQHNLASSTITSMGVSLAIAFCVMLLTSLNWVISLYAILTIICILATTIGSLVLDGWELNILESIVISVAVGLSVDFTLHYGVAYTISTEIGRVNQVKYALGHIGPAVTLAAITTFIAGVFMMFSTVLAYFQLGQFLTLVMAISWLFATFFFVSLCYFAGPVGHFGQINSTKCGSCKVSDEP